MSEKVFRPSGQFQKSVWESAKVRVKCNRRLLQCAGSLEVQVWPTWPWPGIFAWSMWPGMYNHHWALARGWSHYRTQEIHLLELSLEFLSPELVWAKWAWQDFGWALVVDTGLLLSDEYCRLKEDWALEKICSLVSFFSGSQISPTL